MLSKSLAAVPLILVAAMSGPAQAQSEDQATSSYQTPPAPYAQPPYDAQQTPTYNYDHNYYGYGSFDFDRGLLSAVNACAYRAMRSNFGRITVNEIVRTTYNRFVVRGTTNPYGFYGPGSNQYPYGYHYPYPPHRLSFTCTADIDGRVISWSTRR